VSWLFRPGRKDRGQVFFADLIISFSFVLLFFIALSQLKEASFFSFHDYIKLEEYRAKTTTALDIVLESGSCDSLININCIDPSKLNITKESLGLSDYGCYIKLSNAQEQFSFCLSPPPEKEFFSLSREVFFKGEKDMLTLYVWPAKE